IKYKMKLYLTLFVFVMLYSCRQGNKANTTEEGQSTTANVGCCDTQPDRISRLQAGNIPVTEAQASSLSSTEGMIYIEGGVFTMGARDNRYARNDEYPAHRVRVNSFYMDQHPVTNAQFKEFVEATGYITTAEKPIDWEELKKQLPPGTPKPDDQY